MKNILASSTRFLLTVSIVITVRFLLEAGPPPETKPKPTYTPTGTSPVNPGTVTPQSPSYTPTGTSPGSPGVVAPSVQPTTFSPGPGVITSGLYYDTTHFRSEVLLSVELGVDNFRPRTRTEAFLLLTNGQVIRGISAYPSPGSRSFWFRFSGSEKRIYKSELVIYEGHRTSTETVDNAYITRYFLHTNVFDKNTSAPIEGKQNMSTFDVSYTGKGYKVTGSWCLESYVINPFTSYPDYLKNETSANGAISFYLLTGQDDMKAKASEVNLLANLKSGGDITKIPFFMTDQGVSDYDKFEIGPAWHSAAGYDEKLTLSVPFTNINKVGIRYRYRTTGLDFDDWQLRGVAINFVSSLKEEYRIFTRWDLERKFKGNDPAYLNTWWSPGSFHP